METRVWTSFLVTVKLQHWHQSSSSLTLTPLHNRLPGVPARGPHLLSACANACAPKGLSFFSSEVRLIQLRFSKTWALKSASMLQVCTSVFYLQSPKTDANINLVLETTLLCKRRWVQNKTLKKSQAITHPTPSLAIFFLYLHLALMTNSIEKELIYALSLLTAPWNFSH